MSYFARLCVETVDVLDAIGKPLLRKHGESKSTQELRRDPHRRVHG